MENPWGHRSKMEFTFGQEGPQVILGLHRRASFQQIVNIRSCEVVPPAVNLLLETIRETANRFPERAYDPRSHRGFWRYAVVRIAAGSAEMMLTVVTHEGPREPLEALAQALSRKVPSVRGIYWGVSTRVSDVAWPERLIHLAGAQWLEDQSGDLKFRAGPFSFVQPNTVLAHRVYQEIRDQCALTGQEAVYDLYCGIGLIALSLAGRARIVYGVESERENVAFAQANAALNGVSNTLFLQGKVEDLLRGQALFKAGMKPDRIILDPPRAGLHKEVHGPLLQAQAPLLLYLSCNPASMARDLKILLQRDPRCRLESLQMFDFFPHTVHQEVLAVLRRV